jgi:hypothetical protein
MRLLSRLGVVALPALLFWSCSGPAASSGSSAVPAQAPANAASDVATSRILFHPLVFTPHTTAAILMDFVATGPAQRGVPCTGCVTGAGKDTIGLSGPSNVVPKGATWQYSVAFTDVSYKGTCTFTWTIVNGAKTIDTFSAKLDIPQAGGWYVYGTDRAPESYSGSATVTGQVACGSHKQSASAPMLFE